MSSGIIDKNNLYFNRRSIRLKNYDYSRAGGYKRTSLSAPDTKASCLSGAYFITICTNERENMFGEIISDKMILNEYGKIANSCWIEIPEHFPDVELDEYVIMPNHIHGIILISNDNHVVGAGLAPALDNINNHASDNINDRATAVYTNRATARVAPTIGNVVGAFKSIVSNECLKLFKMNNKRMGKIWQRNYYEHIIRNDKELNTMRDYIMNNAAKWNEDENNPILFNKLNS
jgi:putative transposase